MNTYYTNWDTEEFILYYKGYKKNSLDNSIIDESFFKEVIYLPQNLSEEIKTYSGTCEYMGLTNEYQIIQYPKDVGYKLVLKPYQKIHPYNTTYLILYYDIISFGEVVYSGEYLWEFEPNTTDILVARTLSDGIIVEYQGQELHSESVEIYLLPNSGGGDDDWESGEVDGIWYTYKKRLKWNEENSQIYYILPNDTNINEDYIYCGINDSFLNEKTYDGNYIANNTPLPYHIIQGAKDDWSDVKITGLRFRIYPVEGTKTVEWDVTQVEFTYRTRLQYTKTDGTSVEEYSDYKTFITDDFGQNLGDTQLTHKFTKTETLVIPDREPLTAEYTFIVIQKYNETPIDVIYDIYCDEPVVVNWDDTSAEVGYSGLTVNIYESGRREIINTVPFTYTFTFEPNTSNEYKVYSQEVTYETASGILTVYQNSQYGTQIAHIRYGIKFSPENVGTTSNGWYSEPHYTEYNQEINRFRYWGVTHIFYINGSYSYKEEEFIYSHNFGINDTPVDKEFTAELSYYNAKATRKLVQRAKHYNVTRRYEYAIATHIPIRITSPSGTHSVQVETNSYTYIYSDGEYEGESGSSSSLSTSVKYNASGTELTSTTINGALGEYRDKVYVVGVGSSVKSGSTSIVYGNKFNETVMYGSFSEGLTIVDDELKYNVGNSIPDKWCDDLFYIVKAELSKDITSIGNEAFRNCYMLKEITIYSDTQPSVGSDTFKNLPEGGVLKTPNATTNWTDFLSKLPKGWAQEGENVPPLITNELRFVASYGDVDISCNNGLKNAQYSLDGGRWTAFVDFNNNPITVTVPQGHTLYVRGKGFSSGDYNRKFITSAPCECHGDCRSLLSYDDFENALLTPFCFYNLFNETQITTVPELPSKTLANDCYNSMFYNCRNLTTVSPTLLPSTDLAHSCYFMMFANCINLTTAPELPATTLADYCYYYMYFGCTSLTTAPELLAESIAMYSYGHMFEYCYNLKYIKVGATSWDTYFTINWLSNVSSTGTFVKPSGTEIPSGVSGIPNGWTVQNF